MDHNMRKEQRYVKYFFSLVNQNPIYIYIRLSMHKHGCVMLNIKFNLKCNQRLVEP